MSRARLVITAVVVEGRGVREVARAYDVSPGWVSRLWRSAAISAAGSSSRGSSRKSGGSPARAAGVAALAQPMAAPEPRDRYDRRCYI